MLSQPVRAPDLLRGPLLRPPALRQAGMALTEVELGRAGVRPLRPPAAAATCVLGERHSFRTFQMCSIGQLRVATRPRYMVDSVPGGPISLVTDRSSRNSGSSPSRARRRSRAVDARPEGAARPRTPRGRVDAADRAVVAKTRGRRLASGNGHLLGARLDERKVHSRSHHRRPRVLELPGRVAQADDPGAPLGQEDGPMRRTESELQHILPATSPSTWSSSSGTSQCPHVGSDLVTCSTCSRW